MLGIGPRNIVSQQIHKAKYRQQGETFDDYCVRYARTTADDDKHFRDLLHGLREQRLLPGGRQQRAVGWPFLTTAMNCYVGAQIPDDTEEIGKALTRAMLTLRSGGGCGWDFSTIRPNGDPISKLGDDAYASGPVSFMGMWHAMCSTIRSAGERRGAMMGVLRVDHPDIMRFVRAKNNGDELTNFNISVAVTDEFMQALECDGLYSLQFEGRRYRDARAVDVWAAIMENNWDWAEPGVLFIDAANRMNPLSYCETLYATNPCGEQWLPPDGACLLFSLNLVKYIIPSYYRRNPFNRLESLRQSGNRIYELDLDLFRRDINTAVRACDNVIENTVYPLWEQKQEALNKRRMGIGLTGVANALEVCGHRYGSAEYINMQSRVLEILRDTCYLTSIDMAKRKGPFPFYDDRWLDGGFSRTLPDEIRHAIGKHGLRNGLLLSIAPTGTISLSADNVSSGIEAPFAIEVDRAINFHDGARVVPFNDYAWEEYGVRCKTALECSMQDHINVLCSAQKYIDNAISKTTNYRGVKDGMTDQERSECVTFTDFKDVYTMAYEDGAKGCSTFNVNGKRGAIITERKPASSSQAQEETYCRIESNGAKVCGAE